MGNRKTHYDFDGDKLIVGGNLLAFLLNPEKPYSRETIRQWCLKGMPCQNRGKIREYDYLEVYKWLWDNENNLDLLNAEKIKAQTAYSKKQTELKDLQIKEKKGTLVSIDDLSKSQVALVELLKAKDILFYTRCTNPELKKAIDEHLKQKWDSVKEELEKIGNT